MRHVRRGTALGAVLFTAALLTGCGAGTPGSQQNAEGVRDAYKEFTHLYLNGKADKACNDYLATDAKLMVKAFGGCESLLEGIPRSDAASDAQIAKMSVTVKGDKATYSLPNDEGVAVYAGGHWRFGLDLDAEDTSAATAAATATPAPLDSDDDGISDTQDSTPYGEDDAAPTEDEADFVEEEAGPKQTYKELNRWGQDDGMRVKVTSVQKVGSIPAIDEYSDPVLDKKSSTLIAVKLTVKNGTKSAIDPLCGGGNGFVLLDQDDRNFQPLDSILDINDNVCDDGIQPGFKSSYTLAFRLPAGSKASALVVWNDDAEDDFSGDISQLVIGV